VQTASGTQSAELTIEGIKEFELLRDFLYSRMRGVKDHRTVSSTEPGVGTPADELTSALREVTRELRVVREILAKRESAEAPKETRHV